MSLSEGRLASMMPGLWILEGLLLFLALALAVLSAYLTVLLVAALIGRSKPVPMGQRLTRFAVLIPAHDEELLLGRLLESLATQHYPRDRYNVFVVADNCTDRTARVAEGHGVTVFERIDHVALGKGHALRWLLDQLKMRNQAYDAAIVLDADSVADSRFLAVMDGHIARGDQVIQGYYTVQNAGASGLASLRFVALAALHFLRPLGRETMRLSCGLKGNGMCFRADVLDRFGWNWYTLAEDVELHLTLVAARLRVSFAPAAVVAADMPVTFRQATSQNARWELGRLQMLRHHAPRLLGDVLRHGGWWRLDAVVEQLIPPLSVPFALTTLTIVSGFILESPVIWSLAMVGLLGQVLHLLAGLLLVQAPPRIYGALLGAPAYIVWKTGLYLQALVSTKTMGWIRTARLDSAEPREGITGASGFSGAATRSGQGG